MKLSTLLLSVSLATNVALGAWLLGSHPPRNPADSPARSHGPEGDADEPGDRPAEAKPNPAPLWARLDAHHDLRALIAQLRAAGFPPAIVRAMITSLVAEQFDAERYKIDEAALHTPYWRAWPVSFLDPKVGPALRKLQQEQQALVKSLLGETDLGTEESKAWSEALYGKLSPEKIDRLSAYLTACNEKRLAVFSAAGAGRNQPLLPADREKLAALDKEMQGGLAEFLTPAEIAEYNLRNSNAANNLKWLLNPAQPTEDEFRTIFPLFQTYFDQTAGGRGTSGPAAAAAKTARDTLMAQVASAVGPQRAEELQIALDPTYAPLNRLVSRLDLPLTASKQISDIQHEVQQRAAAVRNNAALDPNERSTQLAALQEEATTKLSDALGGATGLDAYRQNGGQWLSSLAPPKG
jgi:hypothetical protein